MSGSRRATRSRTSWPAGQRPPRVQESSLNPDFTDIVEMANERAAISGDPKTIPIGYGPFAARP